MTAAEQETIILFDREHQEARIYTADPNMMIKLDKLYRRTREYKDHGKVYAVEYEADKKLVSFRRKRRTGRPLTPAQREARVNNLRKAREKKRAAMA